jgi:hypothetical protein
MKSNAFSPAALSAFKRFTKLANLTHPQLAKDQFSPTPPPSRDFGARVQSSRHGSNIDQSLPIATAAPMATDPPVSERQERAMYAAAEGNSTLGIPQHVGKEFVKDQELSESQWNSLLEKRRCEAGRDQEFGGAGPGNPPPEGRSQHEAFLSDLHDGGYHSSDYGVGNPNAIPGRPRDGLDDNQVDLLRPREGTRDGYDQATEGMPSEEDAKYLGAIRQFLKSCGYSDADCAEVIHNYLNGSNGARDENIGGPESFKGMPERGGTMAGDAADDFNKLHPNAFAIDGSRGAYDQQYEAERVRALRDVRREREARAQLAQDTAIAYGHFLSRLADHRPPGLNFKQVDRLAQAMAQQQARSARDYAQPLAQDQTFMPEVYNGNALRHSAQLAATEEEFEEFLGLRPSKH